MDPSETPREENGGKQMDPASTGEVSTFIELGRWLMIFAGGLLTKGGWDYLGKKLKAQNEKQALEAELVRQAMEKTHEQADKQFEVSISREEQLEKELDTIRKAFTDQGARATDRVVSEKEQYIADLKKQVDYFKAKFEESEKRREEMIILLTRREGEDEKTKAVRSPDR